MMIAIFIIRERRAYDTDNLTYLIASAVLITYDTFSTKLLCIRHGDLVSTPP
jgi:hypothetical protein